MRYIIANILYGILCPLGLLIDIIYPEGTQKYISAWPDPDPDDNDKIRFALISKRTLKKFAPNKKDGVGIKIEDWKKLVQMIDTQIIWKRDT